MAAPRRIALAALAGAAAATDRLRSGGIPIWVFHSLDDSGSPVSTPVHHFDRWVSRLLRGRFRFITAGQAVDRLARGPVRERLAVVTFDDACATIREPLKRLLDAGGTGTIFVPTAHTGGTNAWDASRTDIPSVPILSDDALAEFREAGVELGSHTATHARLTDLEDDSVRSELTQSRTVAGEQVDLVAYPFGAVDDRVARLASECGYRAGFTTELALSQAASCPMSLPRMPGGLDPFVDRLVAHRAYHWYRTLGAALRGPSRDAAVMNVLISSGSYVFSDHFPGGEFQIAHAIASGLAQRGHRVHVLAPRVDLQRKQANLVPHEVGGFDFITTGSYWRYRLEWWRFAWLSYQNAKRLVETERIDVIHHIRPAVKGRFSLCWRLGPPFVLGPLSPAWPAPTAADVPESTGPLDPLMNRVADRLNMTIGRTLYEETLERAHVIPVSSEQARPLLPAHRRAAEPVIPFGVDVDRFRPADEPGSLSEILFVGVLEPRKGLDYLLPAVAKLKPRHAALRLTIVGRGRDEARYRRMVEELGLSDVVTLTGPIPFDRIADFFKRCAIFCLPSIGEPFGISLLQAMACGKPIVATHSGGVPEFVEHNLSGLLVPPADADGLVEALDALLSNQELRKRLGSAGRKACEERYSWDAVVDRIECLYRDLVPHA